VGRLKVLFFIITISFNNAGKPRPNALFIGLPIGHSMQTG